LLLISTQILAALFFHREASSSGERLSHNPSDLPVKESKKEETQKRTNRKNKPDWEFEIFSETSDNDDNDEDFRVKKKAKLAKSKGAGVKPSRRATKQKKTPSKKMRESSRLKKSPKRTKKAEPTTYSSMEPNRWTEVSTLEFRKENVVLIISAYIKGGKGNSTGYNAKIREEDFKEEYSMVDNRTGGE